MPEETFIRHFLCPSRIYPNIAVYDKTETKGEDMYQKEIIYMGLYKDGSRIGNAGFLKVENREKGSSLDLKLRNIPYNIRGRFPVRIYNGNEWKEINGVPVQEGNGSWKEDMAGMMERIQLQIMLPGGYFLEGKSKNAPESVFWSKAYEKNNAEAVESREEKEVSTDKRDRQEESTTVDTTDVLQESIQENMSGNILEKKELIESEMANSSKYITNDIYMNRSESSDQSTVQSTFQRTPQNTSPSTFQRIPQNTFQKTSQDTPQRTFLNMPQNTPQKIPQSTSQSVMENIAQGRNTRYEESIQENKNENKSEKRQTIIVTEELQRPNLTARPAGFDLTVNSSTAYSLKEDKWEQILENYEKIHPYGDERIYVKLEPKDFIILQAKYQHLVNNSFLLHGFYNYRYVILGKEQDYYLGVPGVFYEREKMVALMFGFEAFECPGGIAKAGEFGYYLRKVEL